MNHWNILKKTKLKPQSKIIKVPEEGPGATKSAIQERYKPF